MLTLQNPQPAAKLSLHVSMSNEMKYSCLVSIFQDSLKADKPMAIISQHLPKVINDIVNRLSQLVHGWVHKPENVRQSYFPCF